MGKIKKDPSLEGLSDKETLKLIKLKNPYLYKAISIASLAYFNNEDTVEKFISELSDHIKLISERVENKEENILSYDIPEEAKNLDSLSLALITDLKEGTVDSDMTTARLKSLVTKCLDNLKDSSKEYETSGSLEKLENCLGYYDQLMQLKSIAKLADTLQKEE